MTFCLILCITLKVVNLMSKHSFMLMVKLGFEKIYHTIGKYGSGT
mgnify:CR=1 FL=1